MSTLVFQDYCGMIADSRQSCQYFINRESSKGDFPLHHDALAENSETIELSEF